MNAVPGDGLYGDTVAPKNTSHPVVFSLRWNASGSSDSERAFSCPSAVA